MDDAEEEVKCERCSRAATEGGSAWSDVLRRTVTYAACELHTQEVRLKFHASITVLSETVQTELAL